VLRPRYAYPAPSPTPISSTPLTQPPGGWDATGAIPTSIADEIEQAFANVDACLRSAGATGGWAQVYKVNLYTTDVGDVFTAWTASMKKWAGESHRPLLTGVGVTALGVPGMRIEIEVVAHLPAEAAS
jgi:enamine deaminase RidA (YjgF/YER057c/UK114 family)